MHDKDIRQGKDQQKGRYILVFKVVLFKVWLQLKLTSRFFTMFNTWLFVKFTHTNNQVAGVCTNRKWVKNRLREKFKPSLLSHLCTPDQSLHKACKIDGSNQPTITLFEAHWENVFATCACEHDWCSWAPWRLFYFFVEVLQPLEQHCLSWLHFSSSALD